MTAIESFVKVCVGNRYAVVTVSDEDGGLFVSAKAARFPEVVFPVTRHQLLALIEFVANRMSVDGRMLIQLDKHTITAKVAEGLTTITLSNGRTSISAARLSFEVVALFFEALEAMLEAWQ